MHIKFDKKEEVCSLVKNMRDGIFIIDKNSIFVLANKSLAKIFGFASDKAITGKNFLDFLEFDDDKKILQKIIKSGKPPKALKVFIVDKKGKRKYIDIRATAFKKNNKILGIRGIVRDITDIHKIEKALGKSREQYKNLIENINEIIYIVRVGKDPMKSKLSYVSKQVKNILGFEAKELIKNPNVWFDNIHPQDIKKVSVTTQEIIKNKKVGVRSYRVKNKISGKYVWLEDLVTPQLNTKGRVVALNGVARDITERKKIEKKAQELNAVKNKFITVVSHQLRTPLSSIMWNLEILLSGNLGALKKEQQEFIRSIYEIEGSVISRLNDLLLALDIEEGKIIIFKEEVSVESLLSSVLSKLNREVKLKNIDLTYHPPKVSLPLVSVDREKISLVFKHLLKNAIIYSSKNSKINVSLKLKNGNIYFEVKDEGIGIPKTEQSKIFSKFFRASNAFTEATDQSGLGLFISKYYVEKHNGKIGFKSTEGKGTVFWVEMPINQS